MVLGKNIRYLRKQKDMSQDKLAELLGYKSFTTIQKWESGVAEPYLMGIKESQRWTPKDTQSLAT